MEKELTVFDCLNINEWYNIARKEKRLNSLSVGTLWAIRKNIKKIEDVAKNFSEFRDNLEQELRDAFYNDEKSEDAVIEDENGENVSVRRVKKEYLEEYQNKLAETNNKLDNLAMTKEKFDFAIINMDEEIERIGSECSLNIDDLDILSIFEE